VTWKLWASSICCGIWGAILVAISIVVSWPDSDRIATSLSLLVLGAVSGWLFGVVVSPYNRDERSEFSTYAKYASTAFGGYLAGKADTVLSHVAALDALGTVRASGTASAFIITTIIVFAFRRYAT
jgi:hypothetical protein